MSLTKIAITISQELLEQVDALVAEHVYPNRSRAIQAAVEAQLERLRHERLARECARLSVAEERAMAEEGLPGELGEWPEY